MSLLSRQPRPFLFLLLFVVLLASIVGRPDIPIDETRYVSVAWEMWSGNGWLDYLVPHRNGIAYHHKPPLLFWLINLGWAVFGVNDWWPRAISALFSLVCLPLLTLIAQRLWPHEGEVGERAGWLLLGSAFWLFFSTAVVFDIMLTAFVLLALLALVRAADGERWGTWGLFGLALGFGILAKGPVALLPVLPVVLFAPLWRRQRQGNLRWYGGLLLGFLFGVAIALLWAIPAAIYGGEEFRQAIFWGQTAGRMSGSLAHKQPFWFYFAVLPLVFFPWFFWSGAWRSLLAGLQLRGEAGVGVRFCLLWIIPALIVFSLAGGKQAHYLMPLLPAVSLLLAVGLGRVRIGRWAILPFSFLLLIAGCALLLAPAWASKLWLASYAGAGWMLAGAVLIVAALLLPLLIRGADMLPRLALFSGALVVLVLLLLIRPLWPVFDMTPLGLRLQALQVAGVPVAHASAYNDQYHFYGRLRQPLQEISRAEIGEWLKKNPAGRVVVYLKKAADAAEVKAEFEQAYLEGAVVLVDQASALRLPASAR